MAWQWTYDGTPDNSVNLVVTGGCAAIYYMKETMKQAWGAPCVKSSGDGTTYWPASDGITGYANGVAGSICNPGAWFRVALPSGREYTFQAGGTYATDPTFRVMYSAVAGFTIGAPDKNHTPSAADEALCFGTGTDAVPGYSQLFNSGAIRMHCGVDTAAPYPWYMFTVIPAAVNVDGWLHGDGLVAGSYPVGDVEPWITQVTRNTPSWASFESTVPGVGGGWFKYGLSGAAFVKYPIPLYDAWIACPINPYTGGEDLIPIGPLLRYTSLGQGGYKGWMLTFKGILTAPRGIPDYMDDPVTSIRWAYFNNMAVPYPPSVAPVT